MQEKNKRTIIALGKTSQQPDGIGIYAGGKKIADTGQPERLVDLAFVIDTTGSMSDKIEALLNTAQAFVDDFSTLGLDGRIAVVAFGDLTVPGDRIDTTNLTQDINTVKSHLRNVPRFNGGGNNGESSLDALATTMRLAFRKDAVKVILLITDEPALEHHNITAKRVTSDLQTGEFLTFAIAPQLTYYQEMANTTGGQYFDIVAAADFSGILKLFRSVAENISTRASTVHQLAGGSVRQYLALNPPSKP